MGARLGPRNSGGKLVPRLARLATRRRLRMRLALVLYVAGLRRLAVRVMG